jgi:hypothetical protein
MDKEPTLLQKSLLPDYVDDKYTVEKDTREKISGTRINPSQLEQLSTVYNKYKRTGDIPSNKESEIKDENEREKIIENAQWSIYGTQLHSLQYFSQMFLRSEYLNRLPTYEDYQNTFIQREPQYYDALLKLQDLSQINSNRKAIDNSQRYWNTWRMNGQDFTPQKHKNYTISPSIIKYIWENSVVPIRDINTFRDTFKNDEQLDPNKTALINETLLLTNIYFNDGNIQIPTFVDEIRIPKNFPNQPIEIIDYKTGKQFKYPTSKEKLQIFLIMTSVLANIVDRVPTIEWKDIPTFKGKKGTKKLISSVYFNELVKKGDLYTNYLSFKYVNPLNQKEIEISTNDIDIDKAYGIKDSLLYIHTINTFYKRNKRKLKYLVDSSKAPYTLPQFPIENFTKDSGFSREIQLPITI